MPAPRSSSRIQPATLSRKYRSCVTATTVPGILLEVLLEPRDRLGVEMVRRLVEEEQVGPLEEEPAQGHAPPLAAGDLRDVRVGRRAAQRVHRRLERPVQLPAVRRLDGVLDAAVLGHDLLHLGVRQALPHLLGELVEALEERLDRCDAFLDVLEDGLLRIELRVLREEPDARPFGRVRLAGELLLDARHDPEDRRLARAVQAEDADLGAGKEREVDAPEDLPLRRDDLPEVLHREDVLLGHGGGNVAGTGDRIPRTGGRRHVADRGTRALRARGLGDRTDHEGRRLRPSRRHPAGNRGRLARRFSPRPLRMGGGLLGDFLIRPRWSRRPRRAREASSRKPEP